MWVWDVRLWERGWECRIGGTIDGGRGLLYVRSIRVISKLKNLDIYYGGVHDLEWENNDFSWVARFSSELAWVEGVWTCWIEDLSESIGSHSMSIVNYCYPSIINVNERFNWRRLRIHAYHQQFPQKGVQFWSNPRYTSANLGTTTAAVNRFTSISLNTSILLLSILSLQSPRRPQRPSSVALRLWRSTLNFYCVWASLSSQLLKCKKESDRFHPRFAHQKSQAYSPFATHLRKHISIP